MAAQAAMTDRSNISRDAGKAVKALIWEHMGRRSSCSGWRSTSNRFPSSGAAVPELPVPDLPRSPAPRFSAPSTFPPEGRQKRDRMNDIMEDLWTRVSALAALIGAFIAVVVQELWRRIRGRMSTLRWSARHFPIAASAAHDRFGRVEVSYNGQPIWNVQGCVLEIENESSTDLTDVELNLAYGDGTVFLVAEGGIVGSTQALPFTETFSESMKEVGKLPPEERGKHPDVRYLTQRRDFRIPVLNRGARAQFKSLIAPQINVSIPILLVSCDHPGVRLRNRPVQEMWWGEPRNRAAVIGLVWAVLFAWAVGSSIASPLWASFLALVLGAFCIVFGAVSLKLTRLLRRIF